MQYRRAIVPGGTFFFTVVTDRRRPILASAEAVDVLRNAFDPFANRVRSKSTPSSSCPIIFTASGLCRLAMPTSRPAGA
jgi:hypothetical protein